MLTDFSAHLNMFQMLNSADLQNYRMWGTEYRTLD